MKLTLATLFYFILCAALFALAQPSTSDTSPALTDRGAQLMVSASPMRENASPLEGATLSGEAYIFLEPMLANIEEVTFYLNDPQSISPVQLEAVAPFDFAGSREEGAYPFRVDDLNRRDNVVTAEVTLVSGESETLSAAFVAEGVQEAFKADYYVATDGSDSAEGSVERPFATLAKALSVVRAGERIQLRGGVYKEYTNSSDFEIANGKPGAPITLESYPGEMAIVDGSERHWSETKSTGYPALFRLEKTEWFVVQNLTFRRSAGRTVHLEGDHNVVRNVEVYDNHSDGVYITGDNNLLEGVVSHGNYSEQNGGDSADGIKLAFGDSNVVRNCRTYNNSDDGVDTWQTTNTLVEFCLSYENGRGSTGNGMGFKLGPGRSGGQVTARYNIAYKNRASNFTTNGGSNVTLLHNTSWSAGRDGFMFHTGGRPNVAINNISYEDPDLTYSEEDIHKNNTWDLGIENPDFISLNPDSPDFLRLEENSPAVNAGAKVDLPYAGSAPDLGALERGQNVAGAGSSGN